MSERAIAITQASREDLIRAIPWRRVHVPVTTLLLVSLLGAWMLHKAEPLTAPAEQRKETASDPDLSPRQAEAARAVIEPGYASRGGREQLLFLGNSQTMAIPYAQPWDLSTPQWFQVLLARRDPGGIDVHRGSLGGMTMPEVMVRVVAFAEATPAPAAVVIDLRPELFNDLSVRDDVRQQALQPAVAAALRRLAAIAPNSPSSRYIDNVLLKGVRDDQAEGPPSMPWPARMDQYLQSEAEALPLFAKRDLLLQLLNVTFHKYRQRAFGITSASVRTLKRSNYEVTLGSLELALRYTQQKSVHTVLYLGPIRPVRPNPDTPEDLSRIHRDVSELARRYNAECFDYTNLVPENYWTNYEPNLLNRLTGDAGQPDFAHFREDAHRLVAKKLLQDITMGSISATDDHPKEMLP
jgi:hypothetical protein